MRVYFFILLEKVPVVDGKLEGLCIFFFLLEGEQTLLIESLRFPNFLPMSLSRAKRFGCCKLVLLFSIKDASGDSVPNCSRCGVRGGFINKFAEVALGVA